MLKNTASNPYRDLAGTILKGLFALCLSLVITSLAYADEVNYFYDDAGRLQRVEKGSEIFVYAYDEVGNLLGITRIQAQPPILQGIDPDILLIGKTYQVTITGQNLMTTSSLTSDNPAVTISDFYAFDTRITATLTTSNEALPGQSNLTVTTLYGTASMAIALYSVVAPDIGLFAGTTGFVNVSLIPAAPRDYSISVINRNTDIISVPASVTIPSGGSALLPVTALKVGTGIIEIGDAESAVYSIGGTTSTYASPVSVAFDSPAAGSVIQTAMVSVAFDSPSNGSVIASRQVSVGWEPCTRNAPSVTISPASSTITTNGGSAVYTVTVRNNDSTGCSDTTFSLAASDTNTTNFVAPSSISPASVTLTPGAQTTATLTVTAQPGSVTGTNSTTVTASASGHTTGTSNSVTTTLSVPVNMVTGPNSPSSSANNTSIGTVAWTNPGNISFSDNAYATVALSNSKVSNYLMAKGFNFGIPLIATINGIEVKVERKEGTSTSVSIYDQSVKLVKSGTATGADKALAAVWSSTEQVVTYGSGTDLWGMTWTPAEINDPNFGLALSVRGSSTKSGSETAYVDHVTVTVYYTLSGACSANTPTVSITPLSQTITTNGGSASYTVSITNNDTAPCSSATFSLAASDTNTTNFVAPSTLTPSSVTLASGANATATLTVRAQTGSTSGTDSTSVTASASGHTTGISNSVTTTLNVPVTVTAGPKSPTSAANNTSVGTVAWTNPGNTLLSDNVYGTVALANNHVSNYLLAKGFSFAIPSGATIRGIEIKVERKEGTSNSVKIYDQSVKLVKAGAVIGTEKALSSAWSSTEQVITYGSGTDLWGTAWSPNEINDPNFGLAVAVRGSSTKSGTETAYIDNVTVTVYYTQ